MLWQAVDLIFPPFCCYCGRIGYELCPECLKMIELLDQTEFCAKCGGKRHKDGICNAEGIFFEKIHSWGYYNGPLKAVVQKVKYQRGIGLVKYLLPYIKEFIADRFNQIDAVIPLPLGSRREHDRGYNQIALFARPLAESIGVPYLPNGVSRIRETISQVGLSAGERKINTRDAFKGNEKIVGGMNILLMDDITTTGATIKECAKALKMAGASSVYCFTLAKAVNQI